MTEIKTLAGRPIRGEIQSRGTKSAEQRPIEEFIADLDALLAFPEVESVRWRQHTPYFNDGDVCEFGVHGVRVKVTGNPEGSGDYEDGYASNWDIRYDRQYEDGKLYTHISDELYAAIEGLKVEGGRFDAEMRRHFGDPAEVTATREGFDVEGYDHD